MRIVWIRRTKGRYGARIFGNFDSFEECCEAIENDKKVRLYPGPYYPYPVVLVDEDLEPSINLEDFLKGLHDASKLAQSQTA